MRKLSHKQISKRGGLSTLDNYGKEHFSKLGKKGAESKLKRYGREYFVNLSKLGVASRKAKAEQREINETLANEHLG